MERLQKEIEAAATEPFLLTVTGDLRPHCSCSDVKWIDGRLTVRVPRGWDESEARGHQRVTILWPPAHPGGYSLIVDGVAEGSTSEGESKLAVTPTRAVLHRRGAPPSGDSSCESDCIPVLQG
jgi:hypothetical protein